MESLFEADPEQAGVFHPTPLTRGPWSPDAQHGGPPSALLALLVEAHDDAAAPRQSPENGGPMFVARLVVELLKPVPLAPLRAVVSAARPGRKVQVVEADLFHGETRVARASAVRIRRKAIEVPEEARPRVEAPAPPDAGASSEPPWRSLDRGAASFHTDGVEHRFVQGSFATPGPAIDWIRLRVPLVKGAETPPLARVAAAADFGNGVSWVLSRQAGYQFINPDLCLYLHDYPVGEWVCLDSRTWPQAHGVGLAESLLRDERGPIGRSLQSLLLDRVDGQG